jgi:hypothetical protein
MVCNHCNHVAISFRSNVISTSGFEGGMLNSSLWPMSGNIGYVVVVSGMVENVWLTVEITSLSLSIHKLFLLPVLRVTY